MATTQRSVRVDDETWEAYGEQCKLDGRARSVDLLTFMHARINGTPPVRIIVTPTEGSKEK